LLACDCGSFELVSVRLSPRNEELAFALQERKTQLGDDWE
jgi:hypothetical protein